MDMISGHQPRRSRNHFLDVMGEHTKHFDLKCFVMQERPTLLCGKDQMKPDFCEGLWHV